MKEYAGLHNLFDIIYSIANINNVPISNDIMCRPRSWKKNCASHGRWVEPGDFFVSIGDHSRMSVFGSNNDDGRNWGNGYLTTEHCNRLQTVINHPKCDSSADLVQQTWPQKN